jgi:hypothetical protein
VTRVHSTRRPPSGRDGGGKGSAGAARAHLLLLHLGLQRPDQLVAHDLDAVQFHADPALRERILRYAEGISLWR